MHDINWASHVRFVEPFAGGGIIRFRIRSALVVFTLSISLSVKSGEHVPGPSFTCLSLRFLSSVNLYEIARTTIIHRLLLFRL